VRSINFLRGRAHARPDRRLSAPEPAAIVRHSVQIIVNDEPRTLDPQATVADLVAVLGLGPRRIAVEVNRTVVPRAAYGATALSEGDRIEIIHFVGGG
jgi:sulfur carrier protein